MHHKQKKKCIYFKVLKCVAEIPKLITVVITAVWIFQWKIWKMSCRLLLYPSLTPPLPSPPPQTLVFIHIGPKRLTRSSSYATHSLPPGSFLNYNPMRHSYYFVTLTTVEPFRVKVLATLLLVLQSHKKPQMFICKNIPQCNQ